MGRAVTNGRRAGNRARTDHLLTERELVSTAWTMVRTLILSLLVLTASLWSGPLRAAGLYEPKLTYRTVYTPRFAVHYPPGAYNLAVRVGRMAEDCLKKDAELFGFMPKGTIEIVLSDTQDEANGSATVLPKNTLRLYLAAPTELTGLSSYEDWLRVLLTHELAHIVDIDHTAGFTRALRHVFGKVIAYNGSMPQYLSEGVAVWAETKNTDTGRGRSTYVDMVLRCAALDDTFVQLDQAHGLYARYPYGNASYFYGGRFHLYLSERLGDAAVRQLHARYASGLLPMLYYPGAKAIAGKSLPQLWQDFMVHERALAQEVVGQLYRQGLTVGNIRFAHKGDMMGSRYDRRRRVLYTRRSPVDGATVRLFDEAHGGDRLLFRDTFSNRFAIDVHNDDFVYTMASIRHRFDSWGDLYLYDSANKKRIRLFDRKHPKRSLRAREPTLTTDGTRLVFVQTAMQQSWLAQVRLRRDARGRICPDMDVEVLVPPSGEVQHASPSISPDDSLLAESVWFEGGNRDVVILDSHTGAMVRRLTADPAQDGNPTWSADGRYVLWESDNDGISNLYAYEWRTQRYFRVTRVWGGAFQPDVSFDGNWILYRHARGGGFEVKEIPYAPETWEPLDYDPATGFTPRAPTCAPTLAATAQPTPAPAATPASATAPDAAPRPASEADRVPPAPAKAYHQALDEAVGLPFGRVAGDDARKTAAAAEGNRAALAAAADHAPDWQRSWIAYRGARADEPNLTLNANEREGPYAPSRTLLPFRDNWSLYPSIYLLNNDWGLSLTTLGQDSLQYHTWQLTAGTTLHAHRPNVTLSYVNNRWLPTLSLALSQGTTPYRLSAGWALQTSRYVTAAMGWPFARRHQLGLSYTFEHRNNDRLLARVLPGGRFAQLRLSYSFAFGRSFAYSISPEIGRVFTLQAAYFARALGSQRDAWVLTGDARGYINVPKLQNHVLALRLRASYAFGRDQVQNFFLYGTQGQSILSVQSSSLLPLRGFSPTRQGGAPTPGAAVAAAYAEYRFPIWHIQRGLFSWPIYFQHLHAAVFSDVGNTFSTQYLSARTSTRLGPGAALRQLWLSFGAEVRLDFSVAWQYGITVRAGVAQPTLARGHRVIDKADTQVYVDVGTLL